jgi:hypothetical protein
MLGRKEIDCLLLLTLLIPKSDICLGPQSGLTLSGICRFLICDSHCCDKWMRSCQLWTGTSQS